MHVDLHVDSKHLLALHGLLGIDFIVFGALLVVNQSIYACLSVRASVTFVINDIVSVVESLTHVIFWNVGKATIKLSHIIIICLRLLYRTHCNSSIERIFTFLRWLVHHFFG